MSKKKTAPTTMPPTSPTSPTPEPETRTLSGPVELRTEGETFRLADYAALFDTPALMGGFEERIAAGAFRAALDREDVRALFNHDPNYVLGRTTAGTLRLQEDSHGLHYEVDLPDTTWARDLQAGVGRGDITQSSFAFTVEDEVWEGKAKPPRRTITAVKLYDVSPVTYPAYSQTTVSARAEERAAALTLAQQAETALTTVGLTDDPTPHYTALIQKLGLRK